MEEGTKVADVIYTDVWVSMGEPDEIWEERIRDLAPYQVNRHVMDNAGNKAVFMHCLPAFHNLKTETGAEMGRRFALTEMEVTDEVFESPQSLVFEEAENRMHTIKAVMMATVSADGKARKKRKVQAKVDPGLLEGKSLREVRYLPDSEVQWILSSEECEVEETDGFIIMPIEEAREKFSEIREILATESEQTVLFRKGRHSNKWYDFIGKA